MRRCWQAPLDQKPDSRILVEVFEKKSPTLIADLAAGQKNKTQKTENKEEEKRIFFGWLIASSPSISSLEHPVYDIVALSCK